MYCRAIYYYVRSPLKPASSCQSWLLHKMEEFWSYCSTFWLSGSVPILPPRPLHSDLWDSCSKMSVPPECTSFLIHSFTSLPQEHLSPSFVLYPSQWSFLFLHTLHISELIEVASTRQLAWNVHMEISEPDCVWLNYPTSFCVTFPLCLFT
jgi:hypothetical protein